MDFATFDTIAIASSASWSAVSISLRPASAPERVKFPAGVKEDKDLTVALIIAIVDAAVVIADVNSCKSSCKSSSGTL